jgi:branched-chain amino acid aminotransferase
MSDANADLLAYYDGSWEPLSARRLPLNCHALQYGTGCFEGIRGYFDGERVNLLFLREHFQRLQGSARMLFMTCPEMDELCRLAIECVRRNDLRCNCYLRPMVFKNATSLGPELTKTANGYMCYVIKLGNYLDTAKGLELCVSSWVRIGDSMIPTRAKASGGYLNSALAKSEAVLNGFDESIMLNERGQVSEGSAENVFLVRDGVLITPDCTAGILEGITRSAILGLAKDLGVPTEVRPVSRTELYRCEECFLVGTGCQVSWVRSIDRRGVGAAARGPVTSAIQQAYENAVYGRDASRQHWLTPV